MQFYWPSNEYDLALFSQALRTAVEGSMISSGRQLPAAFRMIIRLWFCWRGCLPIGLSV